MNSYIASSLDKMFWQAVFLNRKNIASLFDKSTTAKFLDLGCDDGKLTVELANSLGTKNIYGGDIVDSRLAEAKKRGVKTLKFDFNHKFPIRSESFDVVHANQVIEHLTDMDSFLEEIYRILKPNGYAIVSTENGSSWCNIFASIMGWQMFSLTNISNKALGVGNPFAIHRNQDVSLESWLHKTILNIRGFMELFQVHKFIVENVTGAGYFPLPAEFGSWDVTHSHFMTIKARKPKHA